MPTPKSLKPTSEMIKPKSMKPTSEMIKPKGTKPAPKRNPDRATISVDELITEAKKQKQKRDAAALALKNLKPILTALRDGGQLGTTQAGEVSKLWARRGRKG